MAEKTQNKTGQADSGRQKKEGGQNGLDQMVRGAIQRVMFAEQEAEAHSEQAPTRRGRRKKSETAPEAGPVAKSAPPAAEAPPNQAPRRRGRPPKKKPAEEPVLPLPKLVEKEPKRIRIPAPDIEPEPKPQEKKGSDREYKLKIIPLGGLGEVGKNMMLIQYGNDIIVVDGGVSFPEDGMFGVDLVIPDYTYLQENKDKLRAYLLTHGHEDHIGGMPYILRDCPAPVYGSPFTLGLLKNKLTEHRLNADLHPVAPREEISVGPFKVEFIRVTHSIPDAMGLAIHTPVGIIVMISDFKMDMSPIDGQLMDFGRISALGEKGVMLLLSDSTNAERVGFTDSERSVGHTLDKIFLNTEGRIIVTSFASHVHRVQQVLWAAQRTGRKVAVTGRGMQNNVALATAMGYLQAGENAFVDIDHIHRMNGNKLVILTTGSQGEQLSGLTRMSSGEHKQVQIVPGDTVVISATPIPGNERMVSRTVDNLFRLGANVVYERQKHIHVSGHASQEELQVLLNLVKPRYFMPIHGEYRMLRKHALLAQQVGIPEENTIVIENGQMLEMGRRGFRLEQQVPAGRILIDGLGVGDVGATVLRERRLLSEGGIVVISLVYSKNKGRRPQVIVGPDIYTRGFIFEKEYEHIISEMKDKVEVLITPEHLADGSLNDLRNQVRAAIGRYAMERFGRRPVVLTVISQV